MTDTSFLDRIRWTEAVVEMEAVERATPPPFIGSTLRGALGRVLRSGLCDAESRCEETCALAPDCRYYSLFEQSRTEGGAGSNVPKPMILGSPAPEELEALAGGGAVEWPYEAGPAMRGDSIPVLRNEAEIAVEEGARLRFEVGLIGGIGAVVPAVAAALARYGIGAGGGRFKLRKVWDAGFGGRLLYDSRFPDAKPGAPMSRGLGGGIGERARRLRIVFETPALFKIGRDISIWR